MQWQKTQSSIPMKNCIFTLCSNYWAHSKDSITLLLYIYHSFCQVEHYFWNEKFTMEKFYTDYSNKNILISSQDEYKIQLNTNQMISFSTLTKNLTIPLILLSTCQHLLKNGFQTILPMKKYLKKQLFIMKIRLIKQAT